MNWTMQSLMQAGNARKREMCMHRLRYGQTLVNFSVYATGLDEDRFEYDPSLLLGQRLESRQCICVNERELLQCEQFLQLDWCAGCADERNVFDRGWSTNCLNFWCARLLVYLSLFPSLSRAAKSSQEHLCFRIPQKSCHPINPYISRAPFNAFDQGAPLAFESIW